MGVYRNIIREKVTIPEYIYEIVVPNMAGYYDGDYPCDFGVSSWIKCCLHDEDTPSFKYYDYSNSFFCFGCRRGGDVVNLHKYFAEKLNGVEISTEEAEQFLYAYFIKGDETAEIDVEREEKRTVKEDKSSLAAFALYVNNLEKMLCADKTISIIQKSEIYDTIDKVNQLIDVGEADADEGTQYIKEKVKQAVRASTAHKKIIIK